MHPPTPLDSIGQTRDLEALSIVPHFHAFVCALNPPGYCSTAWGLKHVAWSVALPELTNTVLRCISTLHSRIISLWTRACGAWTDRLLHASAGDIRPQPRVLTRTSTLQIKKIRNMAGIKVHIYWHHEWRISSSPSM